MVTTKQRRSLVDAGVLAAHEEKTIPISPPLSHNEWPFVVGGPEVVERAGDHITLRNTRNNAVGYTVAIIHKAIPAILSSPNMRPALEAVRDICGDGIRRFVNHFRRK